MRFSKTLVILLTALVLNAGLKQAQASGTRNITQSGPLHLNPVDTTGTSQQMESLTGKFFPKILAPLIPAVTRTLDGVASPASQTVRDPYRLFVPPSTILTEPFCDLELSDASDKNAPLATTTVDKPAVGHAVFSDLLVKKMLLQMWSGQGFNEAQTIKGAEDLMKLSGNPVRRGLELAAEHKTQQALAQFQQVIKLRPQDSTGHILKGECYVENRRYDEALAEFALAEKIKPNNAYIASDIGATLFRQDKFNEAIASYVVAIKLDPQSAIAYEGLGDSLSAVGRYGEAIEPYKQALRLSKMSMTDVPSIEEAPVELRYPKVPFKSITNIFLADESFYNPPVQLVRRTDGTAEALAHVRNGLSWLPRQVRHDTKDFGVVIILAPTFDEFPTRTLGQRYPYSIDGLFGAYNRVIRRVFLPEMYKDANSLVKPNYALQYATVHELGHAYDHCHGDMSGALPFKIARVEDLAEASGASSVKSSLAMVPRAELFADLFAQYYLHAGADPMAKSPTVSAFPNCFEYIKTVCPPE